MFPALPQELRAALTSGRADEFQELEANTGSEFYGRGFARRAVGRLRDARADFEIASGLAGGEAAAARVEIALCDILARQDMRVAQELADECLSEAEEGSWLQARCLQVAGLACGKLRSTQDSILFLGQALEIFRALEERWFVALTEDTLGQVYASLGQLELATHHYGLSLVEKSLLGDEPGIALTLGNLGRLHLRAGRYAEAERCFLLDLEMSEARGDRLGVVRMHLDLGQVALADDEPDRAEEFLLRAYDLAAEEGFEDKVFFALKDLGLVHLARGELDRAEERLDAAEAVLGQFGEPYLQTVLLSARAELAWKRDGVSALVAMQDAVRDFAREELPDYEIPTLLHLAEALIAENRNSSAELCMRRALLLARVDGFARYLPRIREMHASLVGRDSTETDPDEAIVFTQSERTTADGYTRLHRIGEGGFGEVWLALDHARNRHVALKRLKTDQIEDGKLRRRVLTSARIELEAASVIRHPGVARVFAIGTDSQDRTYVVQEYIDGRPLSQEIAAAGERSVRKVLGVVRSVAYALCELHERGVVHRDLKPENVILRREDGSPVLIDFGIAWMPQRVDEETERFLVGTLRYMAPEQAAAERLDGRADVYALGVILFEWLTGVLPLRPRGKDVAELARSIKEQPAEELTQHRQDLPQRLVELCAAMLAKDPDGRPTSEGVVRSIGRLLEELGPASDSLESTVDEG